MSRPQLTNPRRRPAQERGERRFSAILDSAASLLAEVGYDNLTLNAVAERSRSATGSLYHFFSSKEEIVDALLERLADDIRTALPHVLRTELADVSIEELAHEVIAGVSAIAARHPELPSLLGWQTMHAAKTEATLAARVDSEILNRFEAILRRRAPHLSPKEAPIVARVAMETVRNGVRLISRARKTDRQPMQREAEIALAGYLRARLDLR